jgi:hypothetical protein
MSNINFDIWKKIVEGGLYEYPIKNISKTAKFLPTFIKVKGIAGVFNWIMVPRWDNAPQTHSRVLNYSLDIWIEGGGCGPYGYPMKKYRKTAKIFAT